MVESLIKRRATLVLSDDKSAYDFDIKIIGSNNLNRCLNGDIVAVKLLPLSIIGTSAAFT
jgi:exoribonuclease R